MELTFRQGGAEQFGIIEPLWKELNEHHARLASHNQEHYRALTFGQRRSMIEKQAVPGKIMIETVSLPEPKIAAYCISLVDHNGRGELASIFVAEDLRSRGIGQQMVEHALAWMEQNGSKDIIVTVLPENDSALRFYQRFGFFSRLVLMLRPAGS